MPEPVAPDLAVGIPEAGLQRVLIDELLAAANDLAPGDSFHLVTGDVEHLGLGREIVQSGEKEESCAVRNWNFRSTCALKGLRLRQ